MLIGRLLRRRKNEDEDDRWEIPTSMIDVVFLLLIFFMCASKFRVLERRMDAFLPQEGPHHPPVVSDPVTPIPLKVSTREGVPGVPLYRIRNWVTHDPNELAAQLLRFPRPGKYKVEIDSGQDVPFRHVMSAVDACARADLHKVTFSYPRVRG